MQAVLLALFLIFAPAVQAGFLDSLGGEKQAVFLPPEQAFGLQLSVRNTDTLMASFNVTDGYYLYRDKITFSTPDGSIKVKSVKLPRGEMKQDPSFGQVEVFHHSFQAEIELERIDRGAGSAVVEAVYMGCSEHGLCYPPINKRISVELPDAQTGQRETTATEAPPPSVIQPLPPAQPAADENSQIARLFAAGDFWLIVSFFFGAGLVLAFTPCMFPMIPILSGIIVGRGHKITHTHGFVLSFSYVQGMAITYALAGVAAGFSGQLISSLLQTPWALSAFALIFVALALSMFGLYELQLPSALQSRLTDASNKLHGGHITGVFAMGALSAIIIGPCVAPALAGALVYIGKSHDAFVGGTALYAMALGMGIPLILVGASAGTLLPKAGAWMEAVKRIFGVLMLALAIWIVSPVIPIAAQMIAWAALLIFCGIYLRALDPLPPHAGGGLRLIKGVGILTLLLGVAYLIGALSGARDLLRPLGNIGRVEAETPATLQFSRIHSNAELDDRIAQAGGSVVMLDFYADWCVSCKEMERFTFSDAGIQAQLKPALVLQADVTANTAEDKALLKRFGLYGPPGILFFDRAGKEIGDARVVGYQDVAQFRQTLQRAGLSGG